MKKLILAGMLCLFSGLALAQTVSVQLVWNSQAEEKTILPYIQAVLGGCLMQLFDRGMMGTNTNPVAGTKETFESIRPDAESEEAYIDYIVVFFLDFKDIKTGPAEIRYRLLSVASGKEIGKGTVVVPAVKPDTSQDLIKYYHTLGTLKIGRAHV